MTFRCRFFCKQANNDSEQKKNVMKIELSEKLLPTNPQIHTIFSQFFVNLLYSFLLQVSVPIVSNDRCKSMFLRAGRHEFIPDIFLCAGHDLGFVYMFILYLQVEKLLFIQEDIFLLRLNFFLFLTD